MIMSKTEVAIIDYGLGNLFSIKHACEQVGLSVIITEKAAEIQEARSVILPGVGAFGDAMDALKRLDLITPIKELAVNGKPLLGICLGQQLLFSESEEFGSHKGLDLIPGRVRYFPVQEIDGRNYKVPQVGWNSITPPSTRTNGWDGTLLEGLKPGTNMYFVHSCYVEPENDDAILATTSYGHVDFCSATHHKNIIAFQFHPERSGEEGIHVYQNFANLIRSTEV